MLNFGNVIFQKKGLVAAHYAARIVDVFMRLLQVWFETRVPVRLLLIICFDERTKKRCRLCCRWRISAHKWLHCSRTLFVFAVFQSMLLVFITNNNNERCLHYSFTSSCSSSRCRAKVFFFHFWIWCVCFSINVFFQDHKQRRSMSCSVCSMLELKPPNW